MQVQQCVFDTRHIIVAGVLTTLLFWITVMNKKLAKQHLQCSMIAILLKQ
jgi:hypothetical protein